jgi:hypothetical protein
MIKEIVIYNQISQIKSDIMVNSNEYDLSLAEYEKGIYYVRLILEDSSSILKKLSVVK